MPLARTVGRMPGLIPAALYLLVLGLVCSVPYHIPIQPSYSVSWIFGYNNHAAVVIVLLGGLLAAFLCRELPLQQEIAGKPLTRVTLWKLLTVATLIALVLSVFYGRLDGAGEGVYTADRLRLMLEGAHPYRDFNYAYGAFFLFFPFALVRFFSLPVWPACILSWWVIALAGFTELYLVLRWSGFSPPAQRKVILLPAAIGLLAMLAMSPSYSITRFLTPGFLLMALARMLANAHTERRKAALLLFTCPSAAVCFAVSPETGLAYAVGAVFFLLCFLDFRSRHLLSGFAGALVLLGATCLAAEHLGLFLAFQSFSSGGFNYPLCPAPHLLVFFLALGITAPYIRARLQQRQNSPLMALCCVAVAMLPGALGRADGTHVWSEGLGFFLCAFLLCVSAKGPARFLPFVAFLAFFAIPVLLSARGLVNAIGDPIATILLSEPLATRHPAAARLGRFSLRHLHHAREAETLIQQLPRGKGYADTVDVPALFHAPENTVFYAPFSFFPMHSAPYHTHAVQYGYYLALVNVLSPQDTARKVAELADFPARPLLIPGGAESSCLEPAPNARAEVRTIMLYPYNASAVHAGDVTEPVCAYIRTHYHQQIAASEATFGYGVWLRNADEHASAQ